MSQPILNAPASNAASIEMLRQHFPQAVETDAQGRIRINASALQLALDPSNPAGIQVEEDGYELRWVGKREAYHSAFVPVQKIVTPLPVSLCGVESHGIANSEIQARSLYLDNFMPIDSKIERDTVDDSNDAHITVFAKLPKINIPTPAGNYNPDFGYVLAHSGKTQALYLVVETKGYDSYADIPVKERWKIDSAKQFFKALQDLPALKDGGVHIKYQTKINGESLSQLISDMK